MTHKLKLVHFHKTDKLSKFVDSVVSNPVSYTCMAKADARGGGVNWVTSHPPFLKRERGKKFVNIMVELKANTLGRHLIVISSLWHI